MRQNYVSSHYSYAAVTGVERSTTDSEEFWLGFWYCQSGGYIHLGLVYIFPLPGQAADKASGSIGLFCGGMKSDRSAYSGAWTNGHSLGSTKTKLLVMSSVQVPL